MRLLVRLLVGFVLVAGLLPVDSLAEDRSSTTTKPNILYIFTDDQSIRSLSCYSEAHEWIKTPNIDQLAKHGVRFTTCYTGAWCMPSRATALTGKLQHGIQWLSRKPPATRAADSYWPSAFRKAGYHTGIIGKWHTGKDKAHGRAWDYSAIWDHTNGRVYGGYYVNQSIDFNGQRKKVDGYSTDNYTGWAVDYIKERAKKPEQPWHLWLCYDGVHHPFMPADRHRDQYDTTPLLQVPKDIYPPRPDKPRYMRDYGVWRRAEDGQPVCTREWAFKGRTLTEAVQQYNRAVRALDEGVGKVMAALEATGQLENTIVVFTSDQGYAWGQHGFAWKYAPYDANLRAPLLVRYPKRFPQGAVCTVPVAGHDLIPTFFALAGVKLPWKMHGRNILPLLENPRSEWNEPVMLENLRNYFGRDTDAGHGRGMDGVPWWVFLRKGKYKYIRTLVENEIEELYDLEADPEELVNLAINPKYRKTLLSYRQQLLNELKRTEASMVQNLPKVKELSNK